LFRAVVRSFQQISLTTLLKNKVPINRVQGARTEEVVLLESQKYRQYAADCIRLARIMNASDKETLLEIAAAWDDRAREAERREKKFSRT